MSPSQINQTFSPGRLNNITPFTYRDGYTYLQLLEDLRSHFLQLVEQHNINVNIVNEFFDSSVQTYNEFSNKVVEDIDQFTANITNEFNELLGKLVGYTIDVGEFTYVAEMLDGSPFEAYTIAGTAKHINENAERVVYASLFGAVPESPDSTQTIQSAIDYARDNNIQRVVVEGVHNIYAHDENGPIDGSLQNRGGIRVYSNMTLDLEHAELHAIPNVRNNYNIVRVYQSKNVIIRGGKLVGDRNSHFGQTGEWGYGISVEDSNNVTIESIHISDCWGDGIVIRAPHGVLCDTVRINNVVSDNNRRQGLTIAGGRNILVENSTFSNTNGTLPEAGIDIEPDLDSTIAEAITIRNCRFLNNAGRGFFAMRTGIRDITVESCTFDGNGYNAPSTETAHIGLSSVNGTVVRNSIFRNVGNDGLYDISFGFSTNVVIVNNELLSGGLRSRESECVIQDNSIRFGSKSRGIVIVGEGKADIRNNVIVGNYSHETSEAISVQVLNGLAVGRLVIIGNEIAGAGYGIRCLSGSTVPSYMVLEDNLIADIGLRAISGFYTYASISRNTIRGACLDTGVAAMTLSTGSTNVTISDNTVSANPVAPTQRVGRATAALNLTGTLTNVRITGTQIADGISTKYTGIESITANNVAIEQSPLVWWIDGIEKGI